MSEPLQDDQMQPASLDLRLGPPPTGCAHPFSLDTLQRSQSGCVNLRCIELTCPRARSWKRAAFILSADGGLDLPADIEAVANAKSSTGRLDLLTRTITDHGKEFDRIVKGYTGPLYAEICPRSFSVLVRPGMRLNQIRFRAVMRCSATRRSKSCMRTHPWSRARL